MNLTNAKMIIIQFLIIIVVIIGLFIIVKIDKTRTVSKRIGRYSLKVPQNNFKNILYPIKTTCYGFIKAISMLISNSFIATKYSSKRYNKYIEYKNKFLKDIDILSIKVLVAILNLIIVAIILLITNENINDVDIVISLLVGYFIPDIYFMSKHKFIRKEIDTNLMTAILIIKNSLEKEFDYEFAIENVLNEIDGSIHDEFHKILNDLKHGISFSHSIKRFDKRINVYGTHLFSKYLSVITSEEKSVIIALEKVEKGIMFKNKMNIELYVVLNKYRAFGLFLSVLPVLAIIFMFLIDNSYFKKILEHQSGDWYLILISLLYIFYIVLLKCIFRTRAYYEDK